MTSIIIDKTTSDSDINNYTFVIVKVILIC